MDWQQMISLAIVGAAATLLAASKFRRRKFSFERDAHCFGCTAVQQSPSPGSIVFRARKGSRPEVRVKMR